MCLFGLSYILYTYIGMHFGTHATVSTAVYLTAEDETSVKDYKEIPVSWDVSLQSYYKAAIII